ncbi:MAG: RluA family pseudouridine synthase [Clostridiales bacterium]|nr:RluA family pseudouridine synthase [Clostridiales bacterium]
MAATAATASPTRTTASTPTVAAAADEAMEDLRILYEDKFLVLCVKPVGVLSEDSDTAACMPALLRQHYRALGQNDYIATVHRLDKAVGGVMLFSRRRDVTGKLTAAVAEHRVTKEYLAVLRGTPEKDADTLTDLLFRDAAHNKSYVVTRMRKGVREARLDYTALAHHDGLTLVRVRLHTGRTHQIRVQFSHRGLPLLGDIRYGSKAPCPPALWSCRLALTHPVTGQPLDVTCPPPDTYPWTDFSPLKEMVSSEA